MSVAEVRRSSATGGRVSPGAAAGAGSGRPRAAPAGRPRPPAAPHPRGPSTERNRGGIPELQRTPAFSRIDERLPLLLDERPGAPVAFVGPPRKVLPLFLGSAPEEAGPLEVASGERDLREPGQRIE